MDVISYFKKLVSIPSPSGKEDEIRSYLISEFSRLGYKNRQDDVGNIMFFQNEEGKKLVFSSHMDTVALATSPNVLEDDEYIYTDETTALGADDKAGIAAILYFASRYEGDNVSFLFFVSEETGLYGSSHMDKKALFGKMLVQGVYVIDSRGPVGQVINETVGKTRLTISFKGKSAHAGFKPEDGINAICMASAFISSVKTGRIGAWATSNIGSFIAEGSTNVVPDKAVLIMEVRSISDDERFKLVNSYKRDAQKVASSWQGKVEFFEEDLYSAYKIQPGSALIRRAENATKTLGIQFSERPNTGGSDANNLIKNSIPALVLATGYENAHSVKEKIKKSELELLPNFILSLVLAE